MPEGLGARLWAVIGRLEIVVMLVVDLIVPPKRT